MTGQRSLVKSDGKSLISCIENDVYISGSSESISTDGSSDSISSPLIPRDTSIPQGPIEQVWAWLLILIFSS